MTLSIPDTSLSGLAALSPARADLLRDKSQQLEAAFLAEMLGHAGFGAARESFGGGIGEEQFASFLRQEQATALVKQGGIGLAESLFRALTEADHAKP
ncbi:MAG: rod-binding protein [Paracoccaceae bacterium]|nr:rod-binding protein [Paracoccaceae bacterium]